MGAHEKIETNALKNAAMTIFKGNEKNENPTNIHNLVKSDFDTTREMAQYLASSNLVPQAFRNNPSDIFMAAGMAKQMNMDLTIVLQNLDIIHGKTGWKSTFVIALINNSGRFDSRLMFEYANAPTQIGHVPDNWACRAYAKEKDGTITYGSWISIKMAKDEGWYGKLGSKWQTMPEQMLLYRSSAFFGRIHCSDLLNGFQHTDEIVDCSNISPEVVKANDSIDENTEASINTIEANLIETKTQTVNEEQKRVNAKDVQEKTKKDELTVLSISDIVEQNGFFVNEPREKNGKTWLIIEPIPFGDEINYKVIEELGFKKSNSKESYALEITQMKNS